MEEKEIHLVKKISKELGLTYKELAEEIGYGESILKTSVSQNKISKQLKKAIELYIETIYLKEEINKTKQVKDLLKSFINE